MTEDEKEEMIYRLWEEFSQFSVAVSDNADTKYGFIAGARAALYEVGQKTEPQS